MSVETTAAVLAAWTFSSASLLGLPDHVVRAKRLVNDHLGRNPARQAEHLARQLRRMAGVATSPWLAAEVLDALQDSQREPIELIRLASGVSSYRVSHIFPVELFGSSESAVPAIDFDVADPHVHSGATIGLSGLLGLSLSDSMTRDVADVVGFDIHGVAFAPGVLLCAIRHYLLAVHPSYSDYAPFRSLVADGAFWGRVREVSDGKVAGEQDLGIADFVDTLSAWPSELEINLDVKSAIDDVRGAYERGHPVHGTGTYGLMSSLFLMVEFLRSDHGEGLPSFVDRFSQWSSLRKVHFKSAVTRARIISGGVDAVLPSTRVVGAEFRNTLGGAKRIGEYESEIRADLAIHLRGFADSDAVRAQPRNLTMPVTFRRSVRESSGLDGGLSRSLASHWALTAAIQNVAESSTSDAENIGGVDVVGNEMVEPNWVFVPLLRHLSSVGLRTSCHAGESFRYALEGLRSVGELVLPDRVVDRIGHALALDELLSDAIAGAGDGRISHRAAIDDLCWVLACADLLPDDLLESANRLLELIMRDAQLIDLEINVSNLLKAWVDRRSLDGYRKHLCAGLNISEGVFSIELRGGTAAETKAFYALTHHDEVRLALMDSPLSPELRAELGGFSDKYAKSISEQVVKRLVEEQVVLEACPTSNLRLSGLARARQLPYAHWVDRNIQVSLNSDDPLVLGTSIVNEAALIEKALGRPTALSMAGCSIRTCGGGREPIDAARYAASAELAWRWVDDT